MAFCLLIVIMRKQCIHLIASASPLIESVPEPLVLVRLCHGLPDGVSIPARSRNDINDRDTICPLIA